MNELKRLLTKSHFEIANKCPADHYHLMEHFENKLREYERGLAI